MDDEKSNTLIAQSLQNSEDILEDEPEHEEIPKLPEEALNQSQNDQPPSGISCLISIERCSNLNIRQNAKIQVRLGQFFIFPLATIPSIPVVDP